MPKQAQQRPNALGGEECEARTPCRRGRAAFAGEGNRRALMGLSLHAQGQVARHWAWRGWTGRHFLADARDARDRAAAQGEGRD
jgi:hypothetical protein